MLAIEVNHKWDACPTKDSTQAIKVPNANHMNVMKTILTIIPMCHRECFPSYKSLSRLVICYKKDWAILLHLIYFCYLLPVTNYLITKLSVTNNFSACREYLAENRLSFTSAPHWVRHSYISKVSLIFLHMKHSIKPYLKDISEVWWPTSVEDLS